MSHINKWRNTCGHINREINKWRNTEMYKYIYLMMSCWFITYIYSFLYLFLYLYIYLFIHLFKHLFLYLYIYLSIYLFLYLFMHLFILESFWVLHRGRHYATLPNGLTKYHVHLIFHLIISFWYRAMTLKRPINLFRSTVYTWQYYFVAK